MFLLEEFLAIYLGGENQGLQDDDLIRYLQDKVKINSNSNFLKELSAISEY